MRYHTCNTWTKLTSVFSFLFSADSHFYFLFKKTLHICKSLSWANEGSSGSLIAHSTYLQSRESRKKRRNLTRLRVDWLGSNVRKGLAAILLMSLRRRCSLRRAAGGRKRHTTCRAFVALSSSSPDWGSAVQHKKQCCTMLSKYRVSGKDSEPRNSPKREVELLYQALKLKFRVSGKDSKPRNTPKREVELLYQALKLKFRVSGKDSKPRNTPRREAKLGSHGELDRLLLQLSTAGCPDFCLRDFALHSCWKSKLWSTQAASHWRGPPTLTAIVLVVADGLFGPWGLECLGQAIHRYLILPFPPSLIDCMQSLWMLQFIQGKTRTE